MSAETAPVAIEPEETPPAPPPRPPIAQAAADVVEASTPPEPADQKTGPVFGPRTSSRIRRSSSAFLSFSMERELRVSPVIGTLRKEPDNFEALLSMLTAGKAVLFLPVTDSLIYKDGPVSAVFFEMHVFVPNPANETHLMSLGGIRAILRGGRLIIVGQRLSEHELLATWEETDSPNTVKRTLWDTITPDSISSDSHPSIPVLSDTAEQISITHSTTAKVYVLSRAIMDEDLERTALPKATNRTTLAKPATVPPYNPGYLPTFSFPSQVIDSLTSSLFTKTDIPTGLDDIPSLNEDASFLSLREIAKTSRGAWIASDVNRYIMEAQNVGKTSSRDGLMTLLDNFLVAMGKRLKNSGVVGTGEEAGSVVDGIHAYILCKVANVYFDSVQREESRHDLFMQRRICLLAIAGFGLEHLGLPKGSQEGLEDLVRLAGIELVRVDYADQLKGKLDAIVRCHQTVAERMSSCFPDDAQTSSADTILPLLIYLVVRINPPRLVSNIRFVQKFYPIDKMDGYAAYCLTNLSAVHSYLESVDASMMELPKDLTSRAVEVHVPLPSAVAAAKEAEGGAWGSIVDIPLKVSSQISELWPFRFPPPASSSVAASTSTSTPAPAPAPVVDTPAAKDAPSGTTEGAAAESEGGTESGRERKGSETPTTPVDGTGGAFKDKFRDSLRKRG
ncbi:hypothetical protein HDV00_003341 [Rhizophlyctis rosea]|nr:hypothetical protein HDV00_003341 [Rhizophlyctis rosea]